MLIDETYYGQASDATLVTILEKFSLAEADVSYPFIKNKKIYRQDKTLSAGSGVL